MKYLVKWFDLGEVVETALVSYFHAVRLMKGEGIEESNVAVLLCRLEVGGVKAALSTEDGYWMEFEKVEG